MIKKLSSTLLASLLALALVSAPACEPPKREKLVKVAGYGLQLSALLDANLTLPDTLLAQGVITQARRDEVVGIFGTVRTSINAFNAGMKNALAQESPDYAALVPLVADVISEVQRLNLGVKSEAYKKTLAAIEISLRAVASFFALQIRQARRAGYDDRSLARFVDVRSVRVIEEYAGR